MHGYNLGAQTVTIDKSARTRCPPDPGLPGGFAQMTSRCECRGSPRAHTAALQHPGSSVAVDTHLSQSAETNTQLTDRPGRSRFVHCGQQVSSPAGSRSWRQSRRRQPAFRAKRCRGSLRREGQLSKQKQIPTDDWTRGNAIMISNVGRVRDMVSACQYSADRRRAGRSGTARGSAPRR